MSVPASDRPIRILHLSDIHFRAGRAWDSEPVLRELADFIAEEVADGLQPDLVAFSGDMAFSGKQGEYDLARAWLEEKLWPALPDLPRDRLLLVPGNHDVDRAKVGRGVRAIQEGLLRASSQDEIAAVLGDDGERQLLLARHSEYSAFIGDWLGESQTLPWWQRTIDICGKRVYVAGLDSAWMSCGDEDRGRLLLSRWQLTQTVGTEEAKGADWRVVIVHHPWDYLAEFDSHASRSLVHQHADLVLRGHLHHPHTERVLPPDPSRQCLELAAGCIYETSEYPNAFQWIELSPEGSRVRVLFRTWLHNAWTIDRNQPDCPDGVAAFPLDAPSKPPRASVRSSAPEIPADYRDWLWRRCASAELLGHDTQHGHAITLSQVYVPAVTQPAAPAAVRTVTPEESFRGEEKEKPTLLLQRLDGSSLFVPAPAGAGKSTFCRWAAMQSIATTPTNHPVPAPDGYEEPLPTGLRDCLPLLVPLREFWTAMDCQHGRCSWQRADLEDALAGWVDRSPPPGLSGDLLRAHLQAGSALLLLDGLDEVPEFETRDDTRIYPRALLVSGLADALPVWEKPGNRILLTSRPYGLDERGVGRLGLPHAPILPLPQPLQDLFVTRWFHTLDQQPKAVELIGILSGRSDLAPLAGNPLLLTALCVIYWNGGRLPEDRYQLYQRIVDNVLFHRYPGDAREREPIKARLQAIALGMHTGDDEHPRRAPAAEAGKAEVERLLRRFADLDPAYEPGAVAPVVRCEELLTRSGLLLPRPGDKAAFLHLSLQEFLAAERIARTTDDGAALERILRERAAVPEWRPTLLFLFAGQVFVYRRPEWGLELLDRLMTEQDRAALSANPAPAHLLAEALDLCLAKGYRIPEPLANRCRQLALHAIEDEIPVQARQALGLTLGRLGDPRIHDLRDPRAYVEVPAGTYPYGEEGDTVEIEAFRIGRYPVTNGQYRAFLEDGGYDRREWWSEDGWSWRQEHPVTEPAFWRDPRLNGPNQPVVGVSYWEAEACSAWAGGRLPGEQEWEAAARGPEGYTYPWGDDWKDGISNTFEAGLGVTSPVGHFQRSRQARLGIEDLAGNVWEWCASPLVLGEPEMPHAYHVLKGGSWFNDRDFARCAFRLGDHPNVRGGNVGFRVVCSSPSLGSDR